MDRGREYVLVESDCIFGEGVLYQNDRPYCYLFRFADELHRVSQASKTVTSLDIGVSVCTMYMYIYHVHTCTINEEYRVHGIRLLHFFSRVPEKNAHSVYQVLSPLLLARPGYETNVHVRLVVHRSPYALLFNYHSCWGVAIIIRANG